MRISDWSSDVCSSELGVGKFLRLESMDGIQLEAEDLQMADGKLCLLLRERGFGGQVGKDDLGQRADDAREALVGIGGHAPAPLLRRRTRSFANIGAAAPRKVSRTSW